MGRTNRRLDRRKGIALLRNHGASREMRGFFAALRMTSKCNCGGALIIQGVISQVRLRR